jgi:DNA-binding MarR family transcriptional regulator
MEYEQAEELNAAIRRLAISHRSRAAALLGELGLSIGQEVLLLELARTGPRTQAQLAAAARCEPPTITMAVRKLEAAGLVSRAPSAVDARAIVVSVTAHGEELLPALRTTWQDLAEQTVAEVGGLSVEQIIDALDRLARGLARPRDRSAPR